MKPQTLLHLFITFFMVGLFTFGGGKASLPLVMDGAVHNHGWLTYEVVLDIWGVANSLPGAVVVNTAGFIGYLQAGVLGLIAASLGTIMPSLILVSVAAYFIQKVNKSRVIKGAFYGLAPATTGIITAAAVSMFMDGLMPLELNNSLPFSILFVLSLYAMLFVKRRGKAINPLLVVLVMAVLGIALGYAGIIER